MESSTEHRRASNYPPGIPRSADKPRSSDVSAHHMISVEKDPKGNDKEMSMIAQLHNHGSMASLRPANSNGSIALYPTHSVPSIQPARASLALSEAGTIKEAML